MTACLVCASHDRHTPIQTGTACTPCAVRLADTLTDIQRLAEAATTEPRTSRGTGRNVPSSRPPIDLAGVDPALASVRLAPPPAKPVPLLVVLEGWERLVRQQRHLAPYGPASAARTNAATDPSHATLLGCLKFLRHQHDWITQQNWIDDYATELRACRRTLLRWDDDRPDRTWRIPCPTLLDDGTDCRHPLPVTRIDPDEHVHCRRCNRTWDTDRLLAVAGRDADAWVDPEAAAAATGIDPSTLRRWARAGRIRRSHGRYSLSDIRATRPGPSTTCG